MSAPASLADALDAAGVRLKRSSVGTHRAPCPRCDHGPRDDALGVTLDEAGGFVAHCFRCSWRTAWRPRDAMPRRAKATHVSHFQRRDLARQIWNASFALNPFTAAWRYLDRRMVPLTGCASLRAHAELSHPSGVACPALVCRVDDVAGHFIGVQRIYLTHDGEKAPVPPRQVKLALGAIGGGHVEIIKANGRTIYIAEGVEDAATAALTCPWETVWAGLGSNMRAVHFPPECRRVVICPDADEPGEKSAQELAARLAREGRTVMIARPPAKDFNAARMAEVAA